MAGVTEFEMPYDVVLLPGDPLIEKYFPPLDEDGRSLPWGTYVAPRHLPGKHNQKDHGHAGAAAGPLSPEQLGALEPRRGGWTTATRAKTVAELRKSPEGTQLLHTLDSFQSGSAASIPRLRTDVEKVIHDGGTGLEPGRVRSVSNLLNAIGQSNAGDRKLYRGMIAPASKSEVLAHYKKGGMLDLSLASFTSDSKMAAGYSEKGAGQRVRGKTRTPVVLEWGGGSKHALSIENLSKSRVFAEEKEWIGAGRYRITDVRTKKRRYRDGRPSTDVVHLSIEQEGVWQVQ